MRLSPHLTFNGDCEAAFKRYEQVLSGAELRLFTYGASPATTPIAAGWRDKIIHASLMIGDTMLTGADVPAERYEPPKGFFILLSVPSIAEAERVFQTLAHEGVVHMPLQETFWSPAFGVLVDRFGVPWEISCAA
jgi:PhnB protein